METYRCQKVLLVIIFILFSLLAVLTMLKPVIEPEEQEETTGIYTVNGYNVHSFVEEEEKIYFSGIQHDVFYIVNPKIENNRVYIGKKSDGGREMFFLLPQVHKIEGPVYRIPEGASVNIEKNPSQIVEFKSWDSVNVGSKDISAYILVYPEIKENGMVRVYVPETTLNQTDIKVGEGEKLFFYLHALEILQL